MYSVANIDYASAHIRSGPRLVHPVCVLQAVVSQDSLSKALSSPPVAYCTPVEFICDLVCNVDQLYMQ